MRPPGSYPPGWKRPPELDVVVKKAQRVKHTVGGKYAGTENTNPLKFNKHPTKWRGGWIDKKTGKWREVWRAPNGPKSGGRFTTKPLPGERYRLKEMVKV